MNAPEHVAPRPLSRPLAASALLRLLSGARRGRLTLVMPDGSMAVFTGREPGPAALVEVRDWSVFSAVATSADVGLARAIRNGTVESDDLVALFAWAIVNRDALAGAYSCSRVARVAGRIAQWLRRNTRRGSRRNIEAHYDLGNDFYTLWLDPDMTYSSGLYAGLGASATLEEAQRVKYERVLDRLGIGPGQRVLEIGCGWGAFAELAARRGARVTALTVSGAQYEYARRRIERAGLSHLVEVDLRDYRDATGSYDRIVSLEMLEAVGRAFWPRYFGALARLLAPAGRALVQTITIADDTFKAYASQNDFIRELIFPGGLLPSHRVYLEETARAGLVETDCLRFGRDYARTLREWRARFERALADVRALGFDDAFIRLWRAYLCYCEAGFDAGRIDVVQSELVHVR